MTARNEKKRTRPQSPATPVSPLALGLGPRRMVLNARRIVTAAGNTELILLAMVAIEPMVTI